MTNFVFTLLKLAVLIMVAGTLIVFSVPAFASNGCGKLGRAPCQAIMGDESTISVGCGQIGVFSASINTTALGISPNIAGANTAGELNYIPFECYYWNYNGVVYKQCLYSYSTDGVTYSSDNLILGWINLQGASASSYLNTIPSYIGSTCQ